MKTPIHYIGNAHVDPSWMWRLGEGFEAFLATCRSALERMDETSELIFTASSASQYEFVEQTDPVLFTKIQQAVASGRWEIVGGWWVEADCHIPSGESFLRQGLYGQRYFFEKFGKICKTGYCVDSFGHNANLPQLLNQSGMENYVFMRPDGLELVLPAPLFKWQALSGENVTAYRIPLHYSNFENTITEKIDILKQKVYFEPEKHWMLFFGVGNHGGGPTRAQIAEIIKNQKSRNDLDVRFSSTESFFSSIDRTVLPLYRGELQPNAVGCYSAHSEIKRLNRFSENALLRAEKMCVLFEVMTGQRSDWSRFSRAWKNILLNQFHDTLGGVSIKAACDDAIHLYHEAISTAQREERLAVQRLSNSIVTSPNIETLIVYNPHSSAITDSVEFELWHPDASERGEYIESIDLLDSDGHIVHTQLVEPSGKIGRDRVRAVFVAEIPAFGWRTFDVRRNLESQLKELTKSFLISTETILSNGMVGICFDNQQLPTNHICYTTPILCKDISDTWAHNVYAFDEYIREWRIESIRVIESGPIRGRVRVTSSFNNSKLEEDYILTKDSDEIEVRVFLNFQETNTVLKMRFAHGITSPSIITEIPYSIIKRKISANEYPFGSWLFVEGDSDGLGVLSDSKSSYSCDNTFVNVACARSPLYAHHVPPHEVSAIETLRYHDQGEQEFSFRLVLGRQSWQEAEMPKRTLGFLQPTITHIESGHSGNLSGSATELFLSSPNIIVTCLKRSEDGEGYICRMVETLGLRTKTMIEFAKSSIAWSTDFYPYQIKTFLFSESGVEETNALELFK